MGMADQVTFVKGDKVKVTEGDLQGLWGYVHAVRDDNTVEMMPQLKELTEILPFPPSQLAKTFEVSMRPQKKDYKIMRRAHKL